MTDAWESKRLGDVLTLQRGHDLPVQDRKPGKVPIVSSSGISGSHHEAKAKAPGVVTGRYGTIGQVFFVREDFWPLNTTLYVKDFKGNDPRFCALLLETLDYGAHSDKSSVPGVNRNHLHDIILDVPKPAEQRRIAGLLGEIDDQRNRLRAMNQTLETIARTLFQSWFVDFDPVRAKLDGEKPWGMDPKTAALFPAKFEDSELGEIPKGWTVAPIGDLVDVKGGGTPSTNEPRYWEGGTHAWATPKDLSRLSTPILLGTERRITDAGLAQVSSGLLPAGTVLLSSRAPIGYMALATIPTAVNQGFIAMVCDRGVSSYYALNWTRANMNQIEGRASGTTFQEISKGNYRTIPAVRPDAKVMAAFDALVKPLYDRIEANELETATLTQLRDLLLPRLLSGEIRVPLEKAVAA